MKTKAAPSTVALVASALAAILGSGKVSAQTLPLELEWIAPPQCPSADDVRSEVARQAHVAPGRAPARLDAEARVHAVGGRWRVELRTTRAGVDGYQTLEDESCELLARATALVLALALYDAGDADPRGTPAPDAPRVEDTPRRRPPPVASPASEPPPPPVPLEPESPTVVAPPPPAPAPSPSPTPTLVAAPAPAARAITWALVAGGRVSRGPLPETNLALGVGVDARRGHLLVRLMFEGGPASEQASADAPTVLGRYRAWGGLLAPCVVARPAERLALAACVELGASLLVATGSGSSRDETAFAPWYAAGPAALALIRLSPRTRLEVGAGLRTSLDRPRFALRHLGDVYEVPRIVPGATVGLSIDL